MPLDLDRAWVERLHSRLTVAENTFLLGNFESAYEQANSIIGEYILLCPGPKTLDVDQRTLAPGDISYACLVLGAESLHEQGRTADIDSFLRRYFSSLSKMPLELYQLWATAHDTAGAWAHVADITEQTIRAAQHRLTPSDYQAYMEILLFRGLIPAGRFTEARDLAARNLKLSLTVRRSFVEHINKASQRAASVTAAASASRAASNATAEPQADSAVPAIHGPVPPPSAAAFGAAADALTGSSLVLPLEAPTDDAGDSDADTDGNPFAGPDDASSVSAPWPVWARLFRWWRRALRRLRAAAADVAARARQRVGAKTGPLQRAQLVAALHTALRLCVLLYLIRSVWMRALRGPVTRAAAWIWGTDAFVRARAELGAALKLAFTFGAG